MAKKSKKSKQDIFVSTVVAIGRDNKDIEQYIIALEKTLRLSYTNYEIIIVASGANWRELDLIKKLLAKLPCVRLVILSKEYDIDTAVLAGLDAAIGDYVSILDQMIDPVDSVIDLVQANQSADIVQGVSTVPVKGVLGSSLGRKIFYWYNRKYMNIDIPMNATYLMSFNRKAVSTITRSNRDHRRIRHLARVIGYTISDLPYTPVVNPRKDRSLRGGVIEALETITGYSTHPLRVISWLGAFASLLNLIYAIYVVVINFGGQNVAQGWTTTSLQLSGMFFLLFLAVVIISEYIGRLLSEQRNDQKYIVDDEFTSTVSIADTGRKNITK